MAGNADVARLTGERRVLDVPGPSAERGIVTAFQHGRGQLHRRRFQASEHRAGRRHRHRGGLGVAAVAGKHGLGDGQRRLQNRRGLVESRFDQNGGAVEGEGAACRQQPALDPPQC